MTITAAPAARSVPVQPQFVPMGIVTNRNPHPFPSPKGRGILASHTNEIAPLPRVQRERDLRNSEGAASSAGAQQAAPLPLTEIRGGAPHFSVSVGAPLGAPHFPIFLWILGQLVSRGQPNGRGILAAAIKLDSLSKSRTPFVRTPLQTSKPNEIGR